MNTPQDTGYHPSARASGSPGGTQASGSASVDTEDLAREARSEGREQVQQYREEAADKVDTLADSVKAAADRMRGDDVAHLSAHIADMANGLSRMADGLREKSADEILRDVRRIARENPTLFIAGSIAIGFGITRFARASAPGAADRDRPSHVATSERARWTDADSAVPGTTAQPAEGSDSLDTPPGGLTGAIPAAPGPSATTADAISARAGAAASDDATTGGLDIPSSTDTLRGRNQP
jgi:hypothetical protein